jgi:hypothetical protein
MEIFSTSLRLAAEININHRPNFSDKASRQTSLNADIVYLVLLCASFGEGAAINGTTT